MRQFYMDLADWVESVNLKSQTLSESDYWDYVIMSCGELSRKYDENPLVVCVLSAHLDFLDKNKKGR